MKLFGYPVLLLEDPEPIVWPIRLPCRSSHRPGPPLCPAAPPALSLTAGPPPRPRPQPIGEAQRGAVRVLATAAAPRVRRPHRDGGAGPDPQPVPDIPQHCLREVCRHFSNFHKNKQTNNQSKNEFGFLSFFFLKKTTRFD